MIFKPLEKPELLQIVDLILASLNKNLTNQKIQVSVSDEAKNYLVDKGYDPQLGARPMRRIIQKSVENIVAKSIIAGEVSDQRVIEISLADLQAVLES